MDRSGSRLKILALLVALMFGALSTRLWFLQVLASEKFKQEGLNNSLRLSQLPAPRGRILASNGEVLVGNRQDLEVLGLA
ncbi:MAG: hypothetical protein HY240_04340 [Actinobacteria bacterium]|nr:hypothetical protein [Actinomycetota bacterium]